MKIKQGIFHIQYNGSNLKYKSQSEAMSIDELDLPRFRNGRNKDIETRNKERLIKNGLIDKNGNWI